MTKERFKELLHESGFKNKKAFADEFGLAYSSVNNWGVSNPFPPYLECVFKWAKKAKKYDELMSDLKNA